MGRQKGAAAVLKTSPAYTFGNSNHTYRVLDDNGPGPGAYDVRVTGSQFSNLARGGGFGTSGRLAPYGERHNCQITPVSEPFRLLEPVIA